MSPRGRPAMSQFGVPPFTNGVKWLAILTLGVSVAAHFGNGEAFVENVAFVPGLFFHGRLWTPLTYTFLNPDPFGLLFSLLALWLLGASLEERWGTRRFVLYYLATGALAAVATGLVALLSAEAYRYPYAGNWASVAGLVAAFSVLMPDAQILLYFVPVPARLMLPISAGITLLFMLMTRWFPYLPELFGLGAGVLLAGRYGPRSLYLRGRVWWIDRRLRRSKLRVVRGKDDDDGPFRSGGSGSDRYLH